MAAKTITAQQEQKKAGFQQVMAEVRQRLLDIGEEQDTLTMQKGQLALDYAVGSYYHCTRSGTKSLLERRAKPA